MSRLVCAKYKMALILLLVHGNEREDQSHATPLKSRLLRGRSSGAATVLFAEQLSNVRVVPPVLCPICRERRVVYVDKFQQVADDHHTLPPALSRDSGWIGPGSWATFPPATGSSRLSPLARPARTLSAPMSTRPGTKYQTEMPGPRTG